MTGYPPITEDDFREISYRLDEAFSALLAARAAWGAVAAPDLLAAALEAALRALDGYQAARVKVRKALDALRVAVDDSVWAKVLDLEAAMNAAASEEAEAVWELAWTARTSGRSEGG